jgi:hypothetical protein
MERLLRRWRNQQVRIAWTAFDAWYIPWLFEGDDESDDDSDEDAATMEKSTSETTAATEGWGDIFSKPKGWKCNTCMIQNSEDKKKCVSCETVRPGCEAEVTKESASSAAPSGTSVSPFRRAILGNNGSD